MSTKHPDHRRHRLVRRRHHHGHAELPHIFRRDGFKAQVIEGDSFHRYNRDRDARAREGGRRRQGTALSATSGRSRTCSTELEALFASYGETRQRPRAPVHARRRRGRRTRRRAGHLHRVAGHAPEHRPAVLRGPARRATSATKSNVASTSTCWSAWCRSSTSSGSRSCTATRRMRGYTPGSGGRHDPAPHARLREPHLPAVQRARTSTSSACRPWTPATRSSPTTSRVPTRAWWSSASPTRRASTSRTCCRCCTTPAMTPPQQHRRAGRQDGTRDAADLHADDPAPDGLEAARSARKTAMNAPLHISRYDRRPPPLANALRFLAIDAVEAAKSGHPGMPMGMADIAEVLWRDHLKHDPVDPALGRPRPLRAFQRARLDAALRAAASDRL